jgi:hypothetical protein
MESLFVAHWLIRSLPPASTVDVADLVGYEGPAVNVEGRLIEMARDWARPVNDEGFDATERARARTTE